MSEGSSKRRRRRNRGESSPKTTALEERHPWKSAIASISAARQSSSTTSSTEMSSTRSPKSPVVSIREIMKKQGHTISSDDASDEDSKDGSLSLHYPASTDNLDVSIASFSTSGPNRRIKYESPRKSKRRNSVGQSMSSSVSSLTHHTVTVPVDSLPKVKKEKKKRPKKKSKKDKKRSKKSRKKERRQENKLSSSDDDALFVEGSNQQVPFDRQQSEDTNESSSQTPQEYSLWDQSIAATQTKPTSKSILKRPHDSFQSMGSGQSCPEPLRKPQRQPTLGEEELQAMSDSCLFKYEPDKRTEKSPPKIPSRESIHAPSHHSVGVASVGFDASFGSMSLGGDESLSSDDSFHNSTSNLSVSAQSRKSERDIEELMSPRSIMKKSVGDANPARQNRFRSYFAGSTAMSSEEQEEFSTDDGRYDQAAEDASGEDSEDDEEDYENSQEDDSSVYSNSNSTRITNLKSSDSGSDLEESDGSASLPSFPPVYQNDDNENSKSSRLSSVSSDRASLRKEEIGEVSEMTNAVNSRSTWTSSSPGLFEDNSAGTWANPEDVGESIADQYWDGTGVEKVAEARKPLNYVRYFQCIECLQTTKRKTKERSIHAVFIGR